MKDLHREQHYQIASIAAQVIATLLDTDVEDYTTLAGDLVSKEDVERHCRDNVLFLGYYHTYQGFLYTLYGEHRKHIDKALTVGIGICQKYLPGVPVNVLDAFCKGLSSFAVARETKKRKYIRIAQKIHSTVGGWAKQG